MRRRILANFSSDEVDEADRINEKKKSRIEIAFHQDPEEFAVSHCPLVDAERISRVASVTRRCIMKLYILLDFVCSYSSYPSVLN